MVFRVLSMVSMLAIVGCAPTPAPNANASLEFDGTWVGEVTPTRPECYYLEVTGTVKGGWVNLELFNEGYSEIPGSQVGNVWETAEKGGSFTGKLGKQGFVNGWSSMKFNENAAEGFIENGRCKSTMVLRKT